MHQYATLEDTVYFWFAANTTAGTGGDGATAAAHVRLAGATISDAPILSPSPGLLSHVTYPAGAYEVAVAATNANGFAANSTYAVFCTLAIDSQNPTGFIGSFSLKPVISNVIQIGSATQSATDLKDFADTGYDPATHKVQGVVLTDTATTLTNLPAITTDWLTAAGVKADAVTKIQNGLATPTNITAGTITTVTNLTNAPTSGDLTATMKASINTEVDNALDTAIPAIPTAGSINKYVHSLKNALVNKKIINKITGTIQIFKDDDTATYATVTGAYTEDATEVTALRIEP